MRHPRTSVQRISKPLVLVSLLVESEDLPCKGWELSMNGVSEVYSATTIGNAICVDSVAN